MTSITERNKQKWLKTFEPAPDDTGSPFNRDQRLYDRVRHYHERFRFTCAVETGTFHGNTTIALARLLPRVITIEVDPDFYREVQNRFTPFDNIESLHGSSETELHRILPTLSWPAFFFLDAHWESYWPLRDELELLMNTKEPKLLLVHDCRVPGRDFGFDSYGGQPCELDYVADLLNHDECRYAFNHATTPGSLNRGALFIEHLLD